jgi:hypothetical protein
MRPARIAETPKTHRQLAYSAMRPERRLPHTLPSGAPAPSYAFSAGVFFQRQLPASSLNLLYVLNA